MNERRTKLMITKKQSLRKPAPQRQSQHRIKQFKRMTASPLFAKRYALFSVAVLISTTGLWAFLGARLGQSNADQLSDPYLFEHSATFHGATFPGAHSFLLKWPLFLLLKIFGYSGAAFETLTIVVVLMTVLALAYILYRIQPRLLVFGTLCLALAAVLLSVPPVPYPGALLPVNMALLATRNLEYVVYMAAIWFWLRARSERSWRLWAGVVLMGLLMASDKLFATLAIGAAGSALFIYALFRRWKQAGIAATGLLISFVAAVLAIALLGAINALGITHIASQTATGPYGLVGSVHDAGIGVLYGILGIFTNFGANPAFDATVVRHILSATLNRLASPGGLVYMINALVLLYGLMLAARLMLRSLVVTKHKKGHFDSQTNFALTLLWSSIVALGVFVLSNHYYAVDARYLAISVFAVFVSIAVYTRELKPVTGRLVAIGMVLLLSIVLAIPGVLRTYWDDRAALADINGRNALIAQALRHHRVDVLAGDYWRVLPVKGSLQNTVVMPLAGCSEPRDVLSSKAWQPPLNRHSFAYLLTLDRGLTDYPSCTFKQVVEVYGRPNASVVIAGKLTNPKELLLFYDGGVHKSSQPRGSSLQLPTPTFAPIPLNEVPYKACDVPTVMNVVAHEDDDLLFLNPALQHDLAAGYCVRTVYITAGDAGSGHFYWLNREEGSEAAYSSLIGSNDIWIQRTIKLSDHAYATLSNPVGNDKVSLIFMHLPDGNLRGDGFKATEYQSLQKLEENTIPSINAVDGESRYTSDQLIHTLVDLMHLYQPTEIHTQSSYISDRFPDHSDHIAVSSLTQKAHDQYQQELFEGAVSVPIQHYRGYSVRELPANTSDGDLAKKETAFIIYAKFDGGVCQSMRMCGSTPTYGSYLERQYISNE